MNKTIFGILALVAFFALVCMINTSKTGQASYQQVVHRDYMVYLEDYSPCATVQCGLGDKPVHIGYDRLTENPLCQCPDGRILQTGTRGKY